MPAKLHPSLEEVFNLTDTDRLLENSEAATNPTTVKIAQAKQNEHDLRMELWAEFTRLQDGDGNVAVRQTISPAIVKRKEVFLTLRDCNLEDSEGKPVFKFPLEEKAFNRAWGSLPPFVANEIHEKVLIMNPMWDGEQGEEEL